MSLSTGYCSQVVTLKFIWIKLDKLLNDKTQTDNHSGPTKWSKRLSLNEDSWSNIFNSLKTVCKENKLREFHFKFIHRIISKKRTTQIRY